MNLACLVNYFIACCLLVRATANEADESINAYRKKNSTRFQQRIVENNSNSTDVTQSHRIHDSSSQQRATKSIFENRIVGGTAAQPGQYPFFVNWNGCGASLIHPDIILSAAHCNVIQTTKVCVAGYNRSSCGEGGGVERTIVKRIVHPQYETISVHNDFLVMKIDSAVTQKPIQLNRNPNYPVVNQRLTVIGLGLNETNGTVATVLQQVDVPYDDPSFCIRTYGPRIDSTVQFCAGGTPQGGKDSCQGDSGGPIFDSKGLLVGVVSTGNKCAEPNVPGVYARISGAYDWINQQICQLSSNPPSRCFNPEPVSNPVQRPVSAPSTVKVRVDVKYDNNPNENFWRIRDQNGKVVYESPIGAGKANQVVTTYVRLVPGKYTLYMRDTAGNGMCCGNGNGNFAVYVTTIDLRLRIAVRGNGQFQYVQGRPFKVVAI